MKKCTMCDRIEPDHKINCSACGGYLMPVREKKDVSKTNGVVKSIAIKCSACGKENYAGRTHCVDCGVQLDTKPGMPSAASEQEVSLEAHPACLLASFLLLIWNGYMALCFADNSLHAIIPRIYFDSSEFFMFAAWGLCVFSFIVFCGLCSKMRWAGKMSDVPFIGSAFVLVCAELMDLFFRNETGFSLKTHSHLYLWGVVAVIMLIGGFVGRYYKINLDHMRVAESDEE